MDRVNIGVIGCGYWGPNLIRNLAEVNESNLMVVADLKADRRAYIQRRYPAVQVTSDYTDLFSMPLDAVVVATPPATHFRVARDCLQHGLHVMVEKPLTLTSRDSIELIELARCQDRTLMVGHTFVYNPAVQALKDLITSGELGQVHYIDAVRVNLGLFQPGLDVVWDLAPHDISILLYLLDAEPIVVSAHGADCIFRGQPDIAYINLDFANNALAHVRVSWLDPCKVRRITVVGSRKMVVYDDVDNVEKIKIYDKGVDAPPYTDTYKDFQCSYRQGNIVIPTIPGAEPLRVECQHFLQCIMNHEEPRSCGRVGLQVVRVLEAAHHSLYYGGVPTSIATIADGIEWPQIRQPMKAPIEQHLPPPAIAIALSRS